MKTRKLLSLLTLMFCLALAASAQVYVKVRPPVPHIEVRPPQPSHLHFWIGSEWEPQEREYRYVPGRWELAPRERVIYHKGFWKHTRHGYVWIHGGWR